MPKTKSQKAVILQNLEDKLAKMKAAVMFNFSGIEVKELNKLREKCREEGIDYLVAKKTLLKKALNEQKLKEVAEKDFSGEIATLFSYEDEVAPARILAAFAKDQDKIQFAGGIFEGQYIDAVKVRELSLIPSRQVLLGKLVGCIANPLSGIARVLNAIKESKEKEAV
ncbi:MAG: 50S ribosomal protein L10 [Patescibacteria group bacterium]|jgi:large subunit ribosomal protein L10